MKNKNTLPQIGDTDDTKLKKSLQMLADAKMERTSSTEMVELGFLMKTGPLSLMFLTTMYMSLHGLEASLQLSPFRDTEHLNS